MSATTWTRPSAIARSSTQESDRFPIEPDGPDRQPGRLGLVLGADSDECAEIAASEIARLLDARTDIRDRDTGLSRPVRPGDIAILFRSRESHREFEAALAGRGIPSYVYKGLGFFDADEIKDVLALIQYLADPASDLRAAALMRSRFFGVSDEALRRLAPRLAHALMGMRGSFGAWDSRCPGHRSVDRGPRLARALASSR